LRILDFFKKRTIDEDFRAKILVALLNPKFMEIAGADCRCYSQFYSSTTQSAFESSGDLLATLQTGYDVVHLFCDVTASGNIIDDRKQEIPATLLLQRCCNSDVKLL